MIHDGPAHLHDMDDSPPRVTDTPPPAVLVRERIGFYLRAVRFRTWSPPPPPGVPDEDDFYEDDEPIDVIRAIISRPPTHVTGVPTVFDHVREHVRYVLTGRWS